MGFLDQHFNKLPCVKCGTPMAVGCGCWITLRCTGCGKTRKAELDETDPKGTAEIRMLCPECAKGDRSMIDYFDKSGKQLLPDCSGDTHD